MPKPGPMLAAATQTGWLLSCTQQAGYASELSALTGAWSGPFVDVHGICSRTLCGMDERHRSACSAGGRASGWR